MKLEKALQYDTVLKNTLGRKIKSRTGFTFHGMTNPEKADQLFAPDCRRSNIPTAMKHIKLGFSFHFILFIQ